jgi:hypothetical protein
VESVPGYEPDRLGGRIRVVWEGAEYRGRARETIWDGTATLAGNRIRDARQFNFFNPDRRFERQGETGLAWEALTTGNFGGFDLWLADAAAGTIALATPLVTETVGIADIGFCETRFDAGGLGRALSLLRRAGNARGRPRRLVEPDLHLQIAGVGRSGRRRRIRTEPQRRNLGALVFVGRLERRSTRVSLTSHRAGTGWTDGPGLRRRTPSPAPARRDRRRG